MDGISLWPESGWNGSLNIWTAKAQPTREKTAGSACPRRGLHPRRGRDHRGVRAHPAGGPAICRAKQNLAQEWGPRSDCPPICRPGHLASPPSGLPPPWSFEEPSGGCPPASALDLGLRAMGTVSGCPLPGSVNAPGPGPELGTVVLGVA